MSTEGPLRRIVSMLTPSRENVVPQTEAHQSVVEAPEVRHARLLDAMAVREESVRTHLEDLIRIWEKTKIFNDRLDSGLSEVFLFLSTLTDAQKSLSELRITLEAVKTDNLELKKRNSALAICASEDRDEAVNLKIDLSSKELVLSSLRLELTQANKTIADNRINANSLEEALSQLSQEKQLCDNNIRCLEGDLARIDSEKSTLLNERLSLRTKLSLEIEERNNASKEMSALQKQISDKNLLLLSSEDQVREKERLITALHDQLSGAEARERRATEDNVNTIRSLDDSEQKVSMLHEEIASWKDKEIFLQHKLGALQSRMQLTEKLLRQSREEVSSFSGRELELSRQIRSNKDQQDRINDMAVEFRDLRNEKSDLEGALLRAGQDEISYQREVMRLADLLKQVTERVTLLEDNLKIAEQKNDQLIESFNVERSKLNDIRAKNSTDVAYLNGVNRTLRAEIKKFKESRNSDFDPKKSSSTNDQTDRSDLLNRELKSDQINKENIINLRGRE